LNQFNKHEVKEKRMSPKAVPWSEYSRDRELKEVWHKILSSQEWEAKLPSETWRGYKLQEILWKIEMKEGWEERLIELWKESR
jgi:hypothetical protein